MTVALVYNPNATGFNNAVLNRACKVFQRYGKVKIYPSRYPGNTIELVKKANEECEYVVTLGGDGTMGEAFIALGDVEQKSLYSHISVGTANDTADNLGLYKGKQMESIDLFRYSESLDEIDVDMVQAGDVPFAYVSCCGTFTNLTYETPKSFKQNFGKLGYYMFSGLMGLTTVPDIVHKPLNIYYEKDGEGINTEALTLIVSNSKTFAGFKLFRDALIDDGKFEVMILKKAPSLELGSFLYNLFKDDGEHFDVRRYSKYVDVFSTDDFNVTFLNGEPKNGFNNDGDHSFVSLNGDNSLEYKIGKKVKMLIPNRTR